MRRPWAMQLCSLCLVALLAMGRATAQDAATVLLQQEVLELKRVNQLLERRIEALEQQLAGQGGAVGTRGASAGTTNAGSTPASGSIANLAWLDPAAWVRVKPGTTELEVVRILGVPNSLRSAANGQQVLLYAVEIGAGSFLGGSVTLADHRVVDVQKPTFR